MNVQLLLIIIYMAVSVLFLLTYLSAEAAKSPDNGSVWLGLSIVFAVLTIYQFVLYLKRNRKGSRKK